MCTSAPAWRPENEWQGAGGGMTGGLSALSPSASTMGVASASMAAWDAGRKNIRRHAQNGEREGGTMAAAAAAAAVTDSRHRRSH